MEITGIFETSELLRKRALSPVELTERCLERIDELNPVLNGFITVTRDSALEEARRAEAEIGRGQWRGRLHGIPIAVKDLIDIAGVKTTAASALFQDRVPSEDAEIVRRLKLAGAVFLGKQNLHEFAYGGSSVISFFGAVHNPWDQRYIAGGSSGGSAASIAAGLCFAAVGTDTAGSIREPAAICGVVGLKPTYGRVSARGVIPLSWSLDHVGPIAACVADAAVMLQAIAGHDPDDKFRSDQPVGDYTGALAANTKALKVGVPRAFFYEELDGEIAASVETALEVLRSLCSEVRDISLPVPTDRTLQMAESYAYHAEFVRKSPELYQPETLRRIRSGENVNPAEIERLRGDLRRTRSDIQQTFADLDVLVTPTVPFPPPTLPELKENPERLRPREIQLLRNTRPFNVWGLPAISLPCGFTTSGLPIGLQIAGAPWREDLVIAMAHAFEQATEWHKRKPDVITDDRLPQKPRVPRLRSG